jgi:hypothetical protein
VRTMQHRWTELTASHLFGADGEEDPDTDPQEGAEDDADDDDKDLGEDKYSQEYVEGLRKEAAGHRVSGKKTASALAKAEAELAEIKKADMSDLEAAKTDRDSATIRADEAELTATQATALLKTERIQNAVTMAALDAGFEDPTDALSMISQDDLVDDEGTIVAKTVKSRLKTLADKKPYLLKAHRPGSGDGGPTGKTGGPETYEDKQAAYLKDMTASGGRVPA